MERNYLKENARNSQSYLKLSQMEELRILTGKKHPKTKFQRLRKIRIWTFMSLVHQINSF